MEAYIMIAGVLWFCATFTLTALVMQRLMLHEDISVLHALYGATAWGNSPWDKSPCIAWHLAPMVPVACVTA